MERLELTVYANDTSPANSKSNNSLSLICYNNYHINVIIYFNHGARSCGVKKARVDKATLSYQRRLS